MNGKPLLEITGLDVTYWGRSLLGFRSRSFQAVKGANLAIGAGQTLGLVGESGSGKSSIANAVLGLVPASDGSIRFGDVELASMKTRYPSAQRSQIQAVFQDPYSSLNPSMTVEDIVTEPLRVHTTMSRAERRARAVELLRLVSLSEEHLARHPYQFSGGQRQRIAIASALALEPKLIVLDEPVSALDVSTQAQIINLLQDLQDELGTTYLFIAHDLSVVQHISDRIAVMYLGRIVEEGEADTVYSAPSHPYTQALLSAVPVPDPVRQRERNRVVLRGNIPSPLALPSGCHFHARCPVAIDMCRTEEPGPQQTSNHTTASCHLLAADPERGMDQTANGPSIRSNRQETR